MAMAQREESDGRKDRQGKAGQERDGWDGVAGTVIRTVEGDEGATLEGPGGHRFEPDQSDPASPHRAGSALAEKYAF